jgi:hypothetical protein
MPDSRHQIEVMRRNEIVYRTLDFDAERIARPQSSLVDEKEQPWAAPSLRVRTASTIVATLSGEGTVRLCVACKPTCAVLSTPEERCIDFPEQKYISEAGKKGR